MDDGQQNTCELCGKSSDKGSKCFECHSIHLKENIGYIFGVRKHACLANIIKWI